LEAGDKSFDVLETIPPGEVECYLSRNEISYEKIGLASVSLTKL